MQFFSKWSLYRLCIVCMCLVWTACSLAPKNTPATSGGSAAYPMFLTSSSWSDFQGPSDAKSLAILKGCKDRDAWSCLVLGASYERSKTPLRNTWNAAFLYDKACRFGLMLGCHYLGVFALRGVGADIHYAKSASFFQYACKQGEGRSCQALAELHDQGKGVQKDHALAHTLRVKACQKNVQSACARLAYAARLGRKEYVHFQRFKQWSLKACRMGDIASCLSYIRHQYSRCWASKSTQQRRTCWKDASMHRADTRKIQEICLTVGKPKECVAWGLHLEHKKYRPSTFVRKRSAYHRLQADKAFPFYEWSCKQGSAWGCYQMASLDFRGLSGKRGRKRAPSLLKKSCKRGFALACSTLALILFRTNRSLGFSYLKQACVKNERFCPQLYFMKKVDFYSKRQRLK